MAKIRSPGKHQKWKNHQAGQRTNNRSDDRSCELRPLEPPGMNADPLGVLVNTDSGKENNQFPRVSIEMLKSVSHSLILVVNKC